MTHFAKRLFSLALVCLMALGCLASAESAPEGLLAVINGHEIPLGTIPDEFEYYAAMYEAYGLSGQIDTLRQDVIDYYVQYNVQLIEAEAMGLADLTEEEEAELAAQAQEQYAAMLEEYKSYYAEEGVSDEDLTVAVTEYLEEDGYTPESVEEMLRSSLIIERYYNAVTADIDDLSDEDVQALYEERVAERKASYEEDPSNFEYDVMYDSSDIYYVPEGFRAVYHILLLLDEDDEGTLYDLQSRQQEIAEEIQADGADVDALTAELEAIDAQIDELCAPLLEKANEIYARLDAGEDFFDLMEEYGEDPGMREEPFKSQGYYVSSESVMWEPSFRDGAMALEKEGDVSEPVLTGYGIHLILHGGEVESGAVPLSSVADALRDEALDQRRQEAYYAAIEEAVAAADIITYPENLVYEPSEAEG